MRLAWQQRWDASLAWAQAWGEPAAGLDLAAQPLSAAASVVIAGDIQIGRRVDIAPSPIVLTATVAASGDFGVTVPAAAVDGLQWAQAWSTSLAWREAWFVDSAGRFDLEAQPIALTASVGISGDIGTVVGVPRSFEPPLSIAAMAVGGGTHTEVLGSLTGQVPQTQKDAVVRRFLRN